MSAYFNKIIKHLERKKSKPTYGSNKQPVKVKYDIDDKLQELNYAMLIVDYNYYHIAITYNPEKTNKYHVHIEKECVFGRVRQELGIRSWDEDLYEQEDVVEYIRYKLR